MKELKVKRKNPRVFLSDDIFEKDNFAGQIIANFKKANDFASKVIGNLAVVTPNKTGFKNEDKTLFADYNKKENTLTISKL